MRKESFLENDKTIPKINSILEKCSKQSDVDITSIVLFGSRASLDKNSENDYEFLVFIQNETSLENYIKFNSSIRLTLLIDKITNVNIHVFTAQIFENILFNDKMVGTYLYIICRENVVIFDKNNVFPSLITRLSNNTLKHEGKFLEQCIDFAKELGSEKWGRKWEKALMQFNYNKKRKKIQY